MRRILASFLCGIAVVAAGSPGQADWPTYRGDAARTGATKETVSGSFRPAWRYVSPAPPKLAWSSGEGRVVEGHLLGHRVKFDDALHPVIADGKVFFGSSVDHQLHCIDLKTGAPLWTFYTGGPIRLAPTVADGLVLFGSDDGRVYCLDASSGREIWKLRAGPADEWILARGEMISRWPIRTGVLVRNGIAYFGAGIFPHEDVFLYAVEADTGRIVWKQDNISPLDAGRNDLSPQGYLLASENYLVVPSGRSLPAVFDIKTGRLLHKRKHSWRTTAGGVVGGTRALLADGQIYASGPHHMVAMTLEKGDVGFGWFDGRRLVVSGADAYSATGSSLAKWNRLEYAENSRRRHQLEMEIYSLSRKVRGAGDKKAELQKQLEAAKEELRQIANVGIVWQQKTEDDSALLATGNRLYLGGDGRVTEYDAATGEQLWQAEVPGKANGIVVSDGQLLVSTDQGHIVCFTTGTPPSASKPNSEIVANPYGDGPESKQIAEAAKKILSASGVERGYCLVFGAEEGQLALELARRSDWKIYGVETDAEKVAQAREKLTQAGLYGHRVVIHHVGSGELPYSNYFANVIVSETALKSGTLPQVSANWLRHLKPNGGVVILGGGSSGPATWQKVISSAARRAEIPNAESVLMGEKSFVSLTRGKLPGAGDWSHQYGNPANTAISNDQRVKGDLGVLWYGDPGPGDMVNRHEGAVGPLAVNGRLFVQGEGSIKAYDAYNGVHLWTYENPKAIRTGVFQNANPGNLAASPDRLFHFIKDECFEVDAATGKVVRVHHLPKGLDQGRHEWGYVAVEGNRLYGTATVREELAAQLRRRGRKTQDATDVIFAIDLTTGQHAWSYQGKSISHRTIAISPEKVFFIDSSITSQERAEILQQDKSHLINLTGKEREIAEDRLKKADLRMAVALDAKTGEKLWAHSVDVTDCSEIGIGGGKLTMIYQDGVLVLCGANANGHYWRQFVAGDFSRRRLVALSAEDGYKLWAEDANYRHRPIIIGNKILAEPWMFDLRTGTKLTRSHPLTGKETPWSLMRTGHHCGMLTGADSGLLLFRSGDTGFYDLNEDAGTRHFAGHRLGCWINAIPAAGLVLIPEASAGCVCQFSIASTIVLEPRQARRPWTIYSAVGSQTPVQRMAVNLGAPGDRKAQNGQLWFSFPRYRAYQVTSLDVDLGLQPRFANGGGMRSIGEHSLSIRSDEPPWIYTSWADGLTRLSVPLLGKEDAPARYRLRLHFADVQRGDHVPPLFDVKVQGELLAEGIAPRQDQGEAIPIVTELSGIKVERDLVIELLPRRGTPILNAIEIERE